MFLLPLGLRGPIDDPSISIDDDQLVASLKAAGAAELTKKVEEKQKEVMDEAQKKVDEKVNEKIDDALGGLLKKKKG